MQKALTILFILFVSISFGQKPIKLKGKMRGSYKGEIPAYVTEMHEQIVNVDEAPISIQLDKEKAHFQIGAQDFSGKYKVLFKNKEYYLLEVKIDGKPNKERLKVFVKAKKIVRLGFAGQPDGVLKKKK